LAGYFESQQDDSITSTMFLPDVAEFANGEVVAFSDKLATKRVVRQSSALLDLELRSETLETANLEYWERERTATPVRAFAVWLHATGCSLRETQAILALLGVDWSHQAIFQWILRVSDSVSNPPSAQPTRVAVDETAVRINGE
jgi:hypothetical protein